MDKRNDIEVIINKKRYTLCGYESEDYLQKVAAHINNKISELSVHPAYRIMESEMRNVLIQINLADDYFKSRKLAAEAEQENDAKSDEIYTLKHDIISFQTKLEALQIELERLKEEHIEEQKKSVRLETELIERGKANKHSDAG